MEATLIPLHKNTPHLTNNETLMLEVTIPKTLVDVPVPPPKHVCFVLDTSGSMRPVFKRLIKSVKAGFQKLRDQDSVSIISYSDKVTLLCEWNKCTDQLKTTLENKLNGVRCGGSTNISGALFKSIEQSLKVENGTVTTIFMTDGQANEGVTDINVLGTMLKKMVPENTTIHSLGFTADHNPIFLKKVAEVGNQGLYHFIENEDVLKGSFMDIIGKTFEVAYQNAVLNLGADEVNFSDHKTGKDFTTLTLGDLHLGETRKWIITAKFTAEKQVYDIAANVSGLNVINVKSEVVFCHMKVERGDDNTINDTVQKKLNLAVAAKALKTASAFAQKRDYAGAMKLVRETSHNLRGMPTLQRNLNTFADSMMDDDILETSSHRLTSYQQDLETENDSIFVAPPGIGLGLSPIKTPKKSKFMNFFPVSDDGFTDQNDASSHSVGSQSLVGNPPNLSRNSQSEGDNTGGKTIEASPRK